MIGQLFIWELPRVEQQAEPVVEERWVFEVLPDLQVELARLEVQDFQVSESLPEGLCDLLVVVAGEKGAGCLAVLRW